MDCEKCKEYEELLQTLRNWINSEEVRAAEQVAWTHGFRVSEEYANAAKELWDKVRKVAEEVDNAEQAQ